jgi:hypothetical protein
MKSDEDVRMISAEAPIVFAKACELFILEMCPPTPPPPRLPPLRLFLFLLQQLKCARASTLMLAGGPAIG